MITAVPNFFPMDIAIGEWNASHVVRSNTKPEVLTRAGRIIEPIKLNKKRSAPDATTAGENKIRNGGGNKKAKQLKVKVQKKIN